MTVAQEYNKAIWKLWQSQFKSANAQPQDLIPMMYPDFPKRVDGKKYVLFVGSNPSFSQTWFLVQAKKRGLPTNAMEFSANQLKTVPQLSYAPSMQEDALREYSYFKPFKEISGVLQSDWMRKYWNGERFTWVSSDLLAFRSTNESDVKKFLKNQTNTNFLKAQLKLWEGLVKSLKPDLIVVASAYARDLLQVHSPKCIEAEKGTKYHYHRLFGYPTVFLGMLTGQRALDIGSRNLWKWYIPQLLKFLEGMKKA